MQVSNVGSLGPLVKNSFLWRYESNAGRWDKPIPEVIHLWRHRTSTPNNLEKSRLGCVLKIFYTFLGKNEKNNQTPHWGRDSGIPSSCLRFATSTTRQASSWIANRGHSEGIPSSLPQRGVWNAKLTETQIFRELSIEIESSLFN